MKRIIGFLPVLLLLFQLFVITGCGHNNNNVTDSLVLSFQDPGDNDFPVDEFFSLEKKLDIVDSGEYLLSSVNCVFYNDDYAFLLDGRFAVSKVDLNTGKIVKQICQVGRGPQDYLRPVNITGDKDHIYLLDFDSKRVHVYDLDLNHQDRFDVDYIPSPSSFTKTKDGFIFLNSNEDTKLGAYVLTDDRGVKKASYLELKSEPVYAEGEMVFRVVYTDNCFFAGTDGKMACYYNNTNEMYLYDGKTFKKQFTVKPDDNLEGTRGVNIAKVWSLNGKTLVGYRCDFKPSLGLFDKDGNLLAYGHGKNVAQSFPIYPSGDRVLLLIQMQDLLEKQGADKSVQAQILLYRSK